jgi:hypothetical protein
MVPPTTAPDPTGQWFIRNTDGIFNINNPPLSSSTKRNDSKKQLDKSTLFLSVPCSTSTPLWLFRSIIFVDLGLALEAVENTKTYSNLATTDPNRQNPLPLPMNISQAVGQVGLINDDGPSGGFVRGSILSDSSGSDVYSAVSVVRVRCIVLFFLGALSPSILHHASKRRWAKICCFGSKIPHFSFLILFSPLTCLRLDQCSQSASS